MIYICTIINRCFEIKITRFKLANNVFRHVSLEFLKKVKTAVRYICRQMLRTSALLSQFYQTLRTSMVSYDDTTNGD